MAKGIKAPGTWIPGTKAGVVVESKYVKGGYITVDSIEERDRLLNMVMSVRESIDKIKTAYPYTMKDIIEDEERIKKKKLELESILEQYNELILLYKEKLEEILG